MPGRHRRGGQAAAVLGGLGAAPARVRRGRAEGCWAVEMEAAALYALAEARQYNIICFAHVTNSMGQMEGDFEKGEACGSRAALHVIEQTAHLWREWSMQ